MQTQVKNLFVEDIFVRIGDKYVVNRRQRVKEVSTVGEKRLVLSQSRAR